MARPLNWLPAFLDSFQALIGAAAAHECPPPECLARVLATIPQYPTRLDGFVLRGLIAELEGKSSMSDDRSAGDRLARLVMTKSQAATDGKILCPQVSKALRYIERNYAESTMTLETAARMVGCSPYYLSRLLKTQTNRTFLEHLTDHRLSRAWPLLRESRCSIKEVAALTGFSSTDHFARACKRNFGLGPARIRREPSTQFLTSLRQDLASD